MNTYLCRFATIQFVKTPNTLYSFCYTPQNYLMKYLLQKDSSFSAVFLLGAPSGARFQQVQDLNPPGSGKDIAVGKGVHREVESEGSRMWGTY